MSVFSKGAGIVGLGLTCCLLAGCATSNKALDAAGVTKITNKKIAITTGDRPKFVAKTPGSSFLATQGVVGFLAVHMMSDDIAKKYNIADPAVSIGEKLHSRLKNNHNMQLVNKSQNPQFELKVVSTAFGAANKPLSTKEYFVDYNANAQLRELSSNKLIAEANCVKANKTPPAGTPPNYEELFANDAARLKAELNRKVELCTLSIMRQIFGGSAANTPTG